MAWKSLTAHPVRSVVLGIGFGLGVGVMATLLGVGEVVLEQARAPELSGGGDLLVSGANGRVSSARFVLGNVITLQGAAGAASPQRRADLFLVGPGAVVPVRAHGGIPSLERALGDPETASITEWADAPSDTAWATPNPGDALRAMDRFHPVPDVPDRVSSWAEWLYFKGQSGDVLFYLTFLVGPSRADGQRAAGVRLQLDRGGRMTVYSDGGLIDERSLLASAPDLTIGRSSVRLEGLRYHIALDLPEGTEGIRTTPDRSVRGELTIDATAGRSLAPMTLRGARGWISGYVVPVMSGALAGTLHADGTDLTLSGLGYHDHNWGFWEGVSWRWGQVQHEGRSFVYGRVYPPADAADPERVPAFLIALGPAGLIGYASRVTIDETDDPATGLPSRIVVQGQRGSLDLKMEIAVERAIVNKGGALAQGPDFLQLRATYHVSGEVGGQPIEFTAPGAAETFRGR
jgi:hypothetical protein